MAKLYYKYGTMNSSKTANLLMTAHNYESQGRRILCLKPSLDTRWSENQIDKTGNIKSRALPDVHACELVEKEEDLFKLVKEYNTELIQKYSHGVAAVLVDEAQFLTKNQVKQLADVAENLDIAVLCFGLKNSYMDGVLFEGSSALLYYAQSLEEIKTLCKYCQRKATMNLRIVNGYAIYSGETDVVIGDITNPNDGYAQVCYKHYKNPPAPIKKDTETNKNKKRNFTETLNNIFMLNNEDGFYSKYKKDIVGLTYENYFHASNKADFSKLRYFVVGPIMLDLQEYAKKHSNSKKITGTLVNSAIFSCLYDIFKDNQEEAYSILKALNRTNITFFDDEVQYDNSLIGRAESAKRRCKTLPDGHKYYTDFGSSDYSAFWESLLNSLREILNVSIGFYCVE